MMFTMAKLQALIGVLDDAVHRLPAQQLPPEDIMSRWDSLTGKIAEIHARHMRHEEELEEIFNRLGLHGCIRKGTGLARLYPDPSRRQCGDIDVWVPGPRKAIIKALSRDYDISGIIYQECEADIFHDTEVEIHFHPAKLFNPFSNARLQRWCEKHSPVREDVALTIPDASFNAVYCMVHMYRHYLSGGVGLRQMMDYYYVLRELPAAGRGPAMRTLKRLGIGRFAAATMMALQFNFGLEDEFLLCKPDQKRGRILIQDMISMGNFGALDRRNLGPDNESSFARFIRRNRRTFSYLRLYPREVFWAPFTRIGQFFWRRFMGYI
jgi:hypothetical protein